MYQAFGKAKSWKRVLVPSILLIGLFSIPTTAFLIYIAIGKHDFQFVLTTLLFCFAAFFFPIKHLYQIYTFPLIEIDNNFMVYNHPFQQRVVYNLNKISSVKHFSTLVFFFHNGFPTLVSTRGLSESDQKSLLETLTATG